MTEYQQLVSIARRQGRSLPEIAAAWRSANVRLYRNPRDPGRQARLERERRTGRYLSQGVSFTRALQLAARERNPRRRRPGAGQLELPEAPRQYPVFSVGGGGYLPGRKKAPYWVIVQWAGVPSSDLRWFSHSVGKFSSPTAAAEAAREMAASEGGVYAPSREARHELLRNRNPSPPRLDWRALLALGGLAWLVFRHASGQAPAISLGTGPRAPASSGPIATGQMITFEAWWVKWRNGGQNPPVSMDFPPIMVLDAPDQGAGVPIPAGSPRGG